MANGMIQLDYQDVENHIEYQDIYEDGLANRETNSNERRLYCKYCGKNFKSHNYVKMHERWHRGELNHHCPECNRAFRYPSELKKHITIHTGELPYKCDECDLRFNKAQAVHEHRIRDHVMNTLNEATVEKKDPKSVQPILLQMNNYQPMSFEVVLPNLPTLVQRIEPKLEHRSDPLIEEYTVESYAQPTPSHRKSVITLTNTWRQVQNQPVWRDPPMWREPPVWKEDLQYKDLYHSSQKERSKSTVVDHFMESMGAISNNGSYVQNQNRPEECKDCREIMEYENKLVELRRHNCAYN